MKIPLETAFYMLFLIVTDKKGCPSTHLARQTGLQQKTCWLFRRKVMAAMESDHQHLLEGEVDLVEIELNPSCAYADEILRRLEVSGGCSSILCTTDFLTNGYFL